MTTGCDCPYELVEDGAVQRVRYFHEPGCNGAAEHPVFAADALLAASSLDWLIGFLDVQEPDEYFSAALRHTRAAREALRPVLECGNNGVSCRRTDCGWPLVSCKTKMAHAH